MNWIKTQDKPFAIITPHAQGGFSWSGEIDEPFLVAVPCNRGWYIEKVVLTDQIGLEIYANEETQEFPYEMTDITHWARLIVPKYKSINNIIV